MYTYTHTHTHERDRKKDRETREIWQRHTTIDKEGASSSSSSSSTANASLALIYDETPSSFDIVFDINHSSSSSSSPLGISIIAHRRYTNWKTKNNSLWSWVQKKKKKKKRKRKMSRCRIGLKIRYPTTFGEEEESGHWRRRCWETSIETEDLSEVSKMTTM